MIRSAPTATRRPFALGLIAVLLTGCGGGGPGAVVTVTSDQTVVTSPTRAATSSEFSASVPSTSRPATTTRTSTSSSGPVPRTSEATATPASGNDCAADALGGLTPAQLVGQLLMIGVPVENLLTADDMVRTMPVGGLFLAGHSSASPESMSTSVSALQAAALITSGVSMHISVDQEGGQVQTLGPPGFPPILSALLQGTQDRDQLRGATDTWARELVAAGITLDLAPVADTVPAGTEQSNPPIGAFDRQFGSDPKAVADSVVTVVAAMQSVHLGATVKHFPGLGRVQANTDTSETAVDSEMTSTDSYLEPFRRAIAADTDAVMVSSATYPLIDPDHPAVFSSRMIRGLLRKSLGFNGLVMTDDVGGAVAVSSVPVGRRAVDFIAAGGDMVLTVQETDLPAMTAALTSRYRTDSAFRVRVGDAALHVLRSKQRLRVLKCGSQ